jgi:hypothetical protein
LCREERAPVTQEQPPARDEPPVPEPETAQLPGPCVETETYPAVLTESKIPVTVTTPEHHHQRSSSTPLIPAKTHPALPSTPPKSPIQAIQPAPAVSPIPAIQTAPAGSPIPSIQPAAAVSPIPAIQPAPAISPIPAIQPAPAVTPTEAPPHPPRHPTPSTPMIRQISVSRIYCKVVLFKYHEVIHLRHQLIIIVTNLRDKDRIRVHK